MKELSFGTTGIIVIVGILFSLIVAFLMLYMRDRVAQRRIDRDRLEMEGEQLKIEREQLAIERSRWREQDENEQKQREQQSRETRLLTEETTIMQIKLKETQEAISRMRAELGEQLKEQRETVDTGGYIILELPDNMRSMFSDLLKGFEEYAKLKGYNISFSVDTSLPHKIAFKFTLQEGGISVSTQTVRKDIEEYIEKIKKGESFDDLPVIILRAEHELISTTLKNRMSFLQVNYNLEKNAREFYERMIGKLSSFNGFGQQPSVFIQSGGVNAPKHLLAYNSSHVLQGEEAYMEDNSNNADYSTVTISNSFNTRKEQVEKLDDLIDMFRQEVELNEEARQTLITSFDKIREEIKEEETPSKPKIFKWLSKAKSIIETVVLAHHTTEAAKWIYESFNFIWK